MDQYYTFCIVCRLTTVLWRFVTTPRNFFYSTYLLRWNTATRRSSIRAKTFYSLHWSIIAVYFDTGHGWYMTFCNFRLWLPVSVSSCRCLAVPYPFAIFCVNHNGEATFFLFFSYRLVPFIFIGWLSNCWLVCANSSRFFVLTYRAIQNEQRYVQSNLIWLFFDAYIT